MSLSILVLDANILISAILGNKVIQYLISFNETVDFFVPDTCLEEAKKWLPIIFEKRGLSPSIALEVFSHVKSLVQIIDENIYQERAIEAKQRIKNRDIRDWPAVATALLFNNRPGILHPERKAFGWRWIGTPFSLLVLAVFVYIA